MDRVNGRFFVAPPLLAIPMLLLMACPSAAVPPSTATDSSGQAGTVVQAASQPAVDASRQESQIQLVAGSGNTRPGLLEVIAGRPTGNRNHQHQNMQHTQSRGLLQDWLGGDQGKQKKSAASASSAQTRTAKNPVDWEGIPYHSPTKRSGDNQTAPVADPNARVVRRESKPSSVASPTAVPTTDSITRRDDVPPGLPQPPRDESAATDTNEAPAVSQSVSSRRGDRRELRALEASIARKPSKSHDEPSQPQQQDVVALVPRVAPKPHAVPEPNPGKSPTSTGQTAPSTGQTARIAAADQPQPSVATPAEETPVEETETSPPPQTALATIGKPTATTTTAEPGLGDNANAPVNPGPATGNYSVPQGLASSPATTAPQADQPYAASTPLELPMAATPAATISHRSGPPSSAFSDLPSLNAAASDTAPIGSGVISGSNPGPSPPAYQTARLPGSYTQPYGSESPSAELSVNSPANDSIGATTRPYSGSQPGTLSRSSGNGNGIAMRTIPGHESTVGADSQSRPESPIASDNFDRSTYETRNQMRGMGTSSNAGVRADSLATASELPGIRVVTHGPSEIMIRQTSQFEIRVENRGAIDATGVLVRALIPDWADLSGQSASVGDVDVREQGTGQQLVWTIDHVPAGKSERLFVRLVAARSGSYGLDVDWTLLPQKSVTTVKVHEPRLDLTIEGPDEVVYGQSQTYKVRVLNPGDGTAPNVVFTLSPNSATPQTQKIGDIPPGKEAQFDVELTAQDLGDLKIHGLAVGELDLRAEGSKTIRVSAAKLEAMLNGPELKYQNSDATYNLQVKNSGSVASDKIIATLRIPNGAQYVGGIDGVSLQGSVLRWEITTLPPGAIRNYEFVCKLGSTGEHTFAFDCKGTAAGHADVALSTRVESIADLVLTVNDPPAPAPIGSDVMYEIVIRNRGSKEAIDVRAIAQFSHGIEPRRIEGQSGEVTSGQVLFDPINRIGAGQEIRLRVIAQAERAGHHRFRSEIRSGDTVLVAEEATHYMSPQGERVSRHSSESDNR
jgi:hypothetical protein